MFSLFSKESKIVMKQFSILPAVLFVLVSIILIGCGGGGGGGGNPIASTGEARLVSLTGRVLFNNVPQDGVSVYLYRADEAEIAGLAEQYSAKASVRGSLLPDSSATERTTTTDTNGVYRFDGVPEGEYTLMAQRSATERAALTKLVLSSTYGSVTTKDASLQPTSDIAGTISVSGVTDLTGCHVYLLGTSFSSVTDSAGNFRISYVPTGTPFQLMANFSGAVLPQPIAIEAVADSTTGSPALSLPLVLEKPVMALGSIVGTATRTLFVPGDEQSHAGTLVYLLQNGLFINMTETNQSGVYRFFNLPAVSPNNVYQLRFVSPNYVPSTAFVDVTIVPNTFTEAASITLTPRIQSSILGRLSGRVQKQSFLSLDQETHAVLLGLATGTTPADRIVFNVQSDDQGSFLFTNIPVGTYTLFCADPNYVLAGGPFQREVRAPINDLTAAPAFQLVPATTAKRLGGLTGRVVRTQFVDAEADSSDVIPLRIATGTRGQPGYFEMPAIADADGNFAYIGVPVGTYTLFCGDTKYIFSPSSLIATVTAGIPSINNGQFNLVPNPAFGGYGRLIATITTPIAIMNPIRVTLVSQTTPANNRDISTIPYAGGMSHTLLVRELPADSYVMHLEQASGHDIASHVPIVITANRVTTPINTYPAVSIKPRIDTIATTTNQITVFGASFTANCRIELSHLGQEPWQQIPTSLTDPNLSGDISDVLGGRFMLRVNVPSADILQATYTNVVLIQPKPVTSATPVVKASSITVTWPEVLGVTRYKAVLYPTDQPANLQQIITSEASATFNDLEPATSYEFRLFTIVDGILSTPFSLPAMNTLNIQLAPQSISRPLSMQGSLASGSVIASGSYLYVLDAQVSTKYLHKFNTLNGATQSAMLPGSVTSASKIFSGNMGLYVVENESGSQAVRLYDPVTLTQSAMVYLASGSDMIQATFNPVNNRVYCVRYSWAGATMTELLADLSSVATETSLPNFYMSPFQMSCETSQNGSTIGYSYTYYNTGYTTMFHGFFTGTRTTSAPLPFSPSNSASLQGGPGGSFFMLSDNGAQISTFYELKPTLNRQFVVNSERQVPTSAKIVFDATMNRWVANNTTVTVFDPANTPVRSFTTPYAAQTLCYDAIAHKVFTVTYSDALLKVSSFLADF